MIQLTQAKHYDRAIVGSGILGLWAAYHATGRGERVVVIEKRQIGAGASGGFLGALMPHMPDGWNAKKQFQLEGLLSLPEAIANLEAESGVDCGYQMCGRIMPVTNETLAGQVERRTNGARENWPDGQEILCAPEPHATKLVEQGWINSDIAKFGIQHDTLSARINPRNYLTALERVVRSRCDVFEGNGVEAVDVSKSRGLLELSDGSQLTADKIVVANGYEAYPLLQPFMAGMADKDRIGIGVKGQAVLVEFSHKDQLPIVYHDGVYVVPHAENRVAIGSTSRKDWQGRAPDAFDVDDMSFYERAIDLVPVLKHAPIIERWAAVRPRNTIKGRGTEPFLGPVPGHEKLIALIGGFKITLGIAHLQQVYNSRGTAKII